MAKNNFSSQFYGYLVQKHGKKSAEEILFLAFQKEKKIKEEIEFETEIRKSTSGKPDL